MAKKRAAKVNATQTPKTAKPVRLELKPADHERLDRQADKRGLSMAAFARMLILAQLDILEGGG